MRRLTRRRPSSELSSFEVMQSQLLVNMISANGMNKKGAGKTIAALQQPIETFLSDHIRLRLREGRVARNCCPTRAAGTCLPRVASNQTNMLRNSRLLCEAWLDLEPLRHCWTWVNSLNSSMNSLRSIL